MICRGVQDSRRGFFKAFAALGVGLAVPFWQSPAAAGSYLTRAATLLGGAELEAKSVSRRFHDRELARTCHEIALARIEAARKMLVPPEVKNAHPHLLLTLESYERGIDAAARREHEDFLVALARAREEKGIFVAVLKQAGWELPRVS